MATERLRLRIDAVRAAIAEASKGEFISQEAMDTWIDSWDSDAELPPPEPDIQIRSPSPDAASTRAAAPGSRASRQIPEPSTSGVQGA